jgi:ketosteroid isomerase-like protein
MLRAAVDALNRADLDALRRVTHPDFELVPLRAALTGSYHGYEGLAKFLRDNAETFEVFVADYDEVRPIDDDRLLSIGTVRIKPRHGGPETTVVSAGIVTFRDGLVAGWHDYGDAAKALEAAGEPARRPS